MTTGAPLNLRPFAPHLALAWVGCGTLAALSPVPLVTAVAGTSSIAAGLCALGALMMTGTRIHDAHAERAVLARKGLLVGARVPLTKNWLWLRLRRRGQLRVLHAGVPIERREFIPPVEVRVSEAVVR